MCCIVRYCIVLYCIVLYCIVLYCIVVYCIVLYCIVLYCIVSYSTDCTWCTPAEWCLWHTPSGAAEHQLAHMNDVFSLKEWSKGNFLGLHNMFLCCT